VPLVARNERVRAVDCPDVAGAQSDWVRGISPHGLVCGLLLSVCTYWMRHWDGPMPLVEVVLVIPSAAVSGFVVSRGRAVELGMATGAATATTGYVTAVVAAVLYAATTGPWLTSVTWALLGATLVLGPVVLGATFGALGAVLARFILR
jgi:hypothetical protein